MSEIRAWFVTERGYEEYSRIVFAETRGQAQAEGASLLDRDFMEVSAVRAKKYDKYAEDMTVPIDVLLKDGWWFTCHGLNCCNEVYQDDIENGGMILNGMPYCPDCARKLREGVAE